MKRNTSKFISGAMSAAMIASGQISAAQAVETGSDMLAAQYDEIADVQGEFSFDQDVLAPSDEVFSLFGTAATGVCAKPAFVTDDHAAAEKYYVNVSGRMKKAYTTTLAQLKAQGGERRVMVCSCATGSALAQTRVTGVPVSDMLELAELEDDANAVAFKSADGYTSTLPLQYVLDKDALLVWQIGNEDNPSGLQVWMPTTVAKYFTRQVVEIEALHSDEEITVEGAAEEQRAKISILNHMNDVSAVGDEIIFSGYADDCGTAITAVEFSMDGGKTWTSCATENTVSYRWVAWNFAYTAEKAGTYKLDVCARTADGTVSPLAASVVFVVELDRSPFSGQ